MLEEALFSLLYDDSAKSLGVMCFLDMSTKATRCMVKE